MTQKESMNVGCKQSLMGPILTKLSPVWFHWNIFSVYYFLRYIFFFRHNHTHALGRPNDLPCQSLQRQVPRVVVALLD